MAVPTNSFKAALGEGRTLIGLWQALASPYSAEICATTGFDWLLFDGEHAPNTVPTLLAQLQAVAPYPAHPVGRLPAGEVHLIKQYLDIGFTSLLVPMVETAEHAEGLVRAVRYPPAGVRGVGSGLARAAKWGSVPGYLDEADAQICLLLQVETRAGLQNLEAIAGVEGVDGVFIGPSDLSAALGYRGRPTHPDMQKVIADCAGRIRQLGKAPGVMITDPALVRPYIDMGYQFVAVGTDVGLLAGAAAALARQFITPRPSTDAPRSAY